MGGAGSVTARASSWRRCASSGNPPTRSLGLDDDGDADAQETAQLQEVMRKLTERLDAAQRTIDQYNEKTANIKRELDVIYEFDRLRDSCHIADPTEGVPTLSPPGVGGASPSGSASSTPRSGVHEPIVITRTVSSDMGQIGSGPQRMFQGIANSLASRFSAILVALYLFDRYSSELELWSVASGVSQVESQSQIPELLPHHLLRQRLPDFPAISAWMKEHAKRHQGDEDDFELYELDDIPPQFYDMQRQRTHNAQGIQPADLLQTVMPSLTPLPYPERTGEAASDLAEKETGAPQILVQAVPVTAAAEQQQSPSSKPHVAVILISVQGKPEGVLILSSQKAFTAADYVILQAAESQIDSAIVQAQNIIDLQINTKELEVIYKLDKIRDLHLNLEDMLKACVHEMLGVIPSANISFVMLFDEHTRNLKIAATSTDLDAELADSVLRMGKEALAKGQQVWGCHSTVSKPAFSIILMPLIIAEVPIGVFGALNTITHKPFLMAERKFLAAIGSQMDTAIFECRESGKLRQVLGRCVDQRVMTRLLEQPNPSLLAHERNIATVLFADLRGSTDAAESSDPELFGGYINHFLGTMSRIVFENHGTLGAALNYV
eukprot:TRINITY_DN2144_c0_g1_i7.p1 TRINITY_DN2144_c0_g1~~TRINITY_DN2144_c0_g1_i7.p1  ORF type:complete len:609 (-),score=137.19 TRINITY_DN2144_c0_g1_i7:1315-3141(-)